jgi:hypothetical protein
MPHYPPVQQFRIISALTLPLLFSWVVPTLAVPIERPIERPAEQTSSFPTHFPTQTVAVIDTILAPPNQPFPAKHLADLLNQTSTTGSSQLSKVIPFAQKNTDNPDTQNTPLFVPFHRHQPGRTPFIPSALPLNSAGQGSPGVSISVPSAYGSGWRSVGVGIGVQTRARYTSQPDGGLGFGFGLGNPTENLGVQVGISLVDLSSPLSDGSVSLKLHRKLPEDVAIAVGFNGVILWGNTDGGNAVYGVVSKRFEVNPKGSFFQDFTTNLGFGTGQFRPEWAINQKRHPVGIFGSVALRIAEPISSILEWTGQDLGLGLSIVPLPKIPVVITPAISDITGTAGDGARFIVSIGYGLKF